MNPDRLRRILSRMLDENEFLSPYGIRALSRYHAEHPYIFDVHGQKNIVSYLPAESDSGMFGGNSNWRGPVWMPINALLIRALLSFYLYYGDNFKVECPTGSGHWMTLFEVAARSQLASAGSSFATNPAAGPCMAPPINFRKIRSGETTFCFTNTFMATMAPGWEPAIRRVGRAPWPS